MTEIPNDLIGKRVTFFHEFTTNKDTGSIIALWIKTNKGGETELKILVKTDSGCLSQTVPALVTFTPGNSGENPNSTYFGGKGKKQGE